MEIPKIPIALMEEKPGLFSEVVDWRIVGGNAVTTLRKYPWVASLRHNNKHYCGALFSCNKSSRCMDRWFKF